MSRPPVPAEPREALTLMHDLAGMPVPEAPPAGRTCAAGRIADPQHEPAEILSDERGSSRQALAVEDAHKADVLIAGQRDDANLRAPEAASLPDGTPHADPRLAARGWQVRHGVYVRRPTASREREAG